MKTYFYLRIKGKEFQVSKSEFLDMVKYHRLDEDGDGNQVGLWSRVNIYDGRIQTEIYLDCDKLHG